MENKGARLTEYEEEALLKEIKTLSISEIATLHKRSYGSISSRIAKHAINELEKIDAIDSMEDITRVASVYKISTECLLENIEYHKRPKKETKDMKIKRLEQEILVLKTRLGDNLNDNGIKKIGKCIGCVYNHPSQKYHMVSDENRFGCI